MPDGYEGGPVWRKTIPSSCSANVLIVAFSSIILTRSPVTQANDVMLLKQCWWTTSTTNYVTPSLCPMLLNLLCSSVEAHCVAPEGHCLDSPESGQTKKADDSYGVIT